MQKKNWSPSADGGRSPRGERGLKCNIDYIQSTKNNTRRSPRGERGLK